MDPGTMSVPDFLAYVPISGAPISAVAAYLAAIVNPYVGVQWDTSPGRRIQREVANFREALS